jgi:hypothetical protein
MDTDRIYLVIILTVVIVIGINGILYLVLRRGNEANFIDLTRKSLMNVRNPWHAEDQALQELSRLTAHLKSSGNNPSVEESVDKESSNPEPKNSHAE